MNTVRRTMNKKRKKICNITCISLNKNLSDAFMSTHSCRSVKQILENGLNITKDKQWIVTQHQQQTIYS